MSESETAITDGRVFRGRDRVKSAEEAVRDGDTVRVSGAKATSARIERGDTAPTLAEGNGWVAVSKPAGVPTIADHGGARGTLVDVVAKRLGLPIDRVHPTSRLDRDVSGVVVFATTPAAIQALADARAAGTYERRYVAIAFGAAPRSSFGIWDAPIGRAKDPRHREARGRDPAPAESRYRVVASVTRPLPGAAAGATAHLVALGPVTGRTHQLRVHASDAGIPLLGDRIYGGPVRLTLGTGKILPLTRVYLHAARVSIRTSTFDLEAVAPLPPELRGTWESLGGTPDPWKMAISCELDASS